MRRGRSLHRSAFAAVAAVVLSATGVLTGCGVSVDDAPRDIATEPDGMTVEASGAVPSEAVGSGRIFLVAGGSTGQAARIESVTRDLDDDVGRAASALIAGPNSDETSAGLRTSLPAELTVADARRVGNVVVIDVSPELGELPGSSLILALAQIVYTFDDLEGIEAVSVTVDGDQRPWPDGTGGLTSEPLSVFDYPGLERTSQPAYPAVPGA